MLRDLIHREKKTQIRFRLHGEIEPSGLDHWL